MNRCLAVLLFCLAAGFAGAADSTPTEVFPRDLTTYAAAGERGVWSEIKARAAAEPFNVVATVIFVLAVLHTFAAPKIRHWGHVVEERHHAALKTRAHAISRDNDGDGRPDEVSFAGQVLHFFGEVEAVFGIWALALAGAIVAFKGMDTAIHYLGTTVNFTEPMFVVVIMALASTRPVMRLAEQCLKAAASLGGGRPVAWWFAILTIAPLLGSFITEPAAMTIAALLLAKQFYALKPSLKLMYGTLGLLFVNISIGGTLTHFAAPPVLMVAATWGWDMAYMFTHFGWHAVSGIVISNIVYFFVFRKELLALKAGKAAKSAGEAAIPVWVTLVHVLFLGFTVWMAHHPALFIGGFLFFLAFAQATAHHQSKIELRSPLLVGFFLAGLVVHGGLQGWWIQPVLGSLGEVPLFAGSTVLTAFNDNALITYLATLVPGFTEELKFAVVAGAVTGGGLTVIANAPNPAGQSILQKYFPEGVSPLGLLLGAVVPTLIVAFSFMVL
ncbi:putative Na+/H+ antiporter [Oleiharenicola lentus]|uniref:putative Na+/H+ antiporter n=1 Tax=Oleiharenicola lentus TaxID=2508720 RepID=UPI003F67AEC5